MSKGRLLGPIKSVRREVAKMVGIGTGPGGVDSVDFSGM